MASLSSLPRYGAPFAHPIHHPLGTGRVPLGVFFLFGEGRLSLCRSQPKRAIECYQKAMKAQTQYRNLHHVSYWEMAIAYLALWDIPESLKCWRNLRKESTVRRFHRASTIADNDVIDVVLHVYSTRVGYRSGQKHVIPMG